MGRRPARRPRRRPSPQHVPARDAGIVDVGCANGGLLRHLARLGLPAAGGRGPVAPLRRRGRRGAGRRRDAWARCSRSRPTAGDAGAVVLSHVLEHVQDVRGGLAAARGLLRPGGCHLRRGPGRDPVRRVPGRAVPGLQHRAREPFRSRVAGRACWRGRASSRSSSGERRSRRRPASPTPRSTASAGSPTASCPPPPAATPTFGPPSSSTSAARPRSCGGWTTDCAALAERARRSSSGASGQLTFKLLAMTAAGRASRSAPSSTPTRRTTA